MSHHQRALSITLILILLLSLAALACSGELTPESVTIRGLPQYVCPSATPIPTDTPRPTSPPTYNRYFTANLSNYQMGTNWSRVRVQWIAQSTGPIYLSYSGSLSVFPFAWNGASNLYIGFAPYNQDARSGSYTIIIPLTVDLASIQIHSSSYVRTFSVPRINGSVTQFYPPPSNFAPPPIYPTPRPTTTPYPTPTPYIRTNDYFLNDPIYTDPDEAVLNIRFRVIEMESRAFQGTPTPDPPKTPIPGSSPTAIYAESLYIWTFVVTNFSADQTYTLYPPAQSFVSTITLPGGATQEVLLFPTYDAARLASLSNFAGYSGHTLAPGEAVTLQLAAKGPEGTPYRVSWVMDASGRPDPANPDEPTPIVAGDNIVSWINAVNTDCVGEIAPPN